MSAAITGAKAQALLAIALGGSAAPSLLPAQMAPPGSLRPIPAPTSYSDPADYAASTAYVQQMQAAQNAADASAGFEGRNMVKPDFSESGYLQTQASLQLHRSADRMLDTLSALAARPIDPHDDLKAKGNALEYGVRLLCMVDTLPECPEFGTRYTSMKAGLAPLKTIPLRLANSDTKKNGDDANDLAQRFAFTLQQAQTVTAAVARNDTIKQPYNQSNAGVEESLLGDEVLLLSAFGEFDTRLDVLGAAGNADTFGKSYAGLFEVAGIAMSSVNRLAGEIDGNLAQLVTTTIGQNDDDETSFIAADIDLNTFSLCAGHPIEPCDDVGAAGDDNETPANRLIRVTTLARDITHSLVTEPLIVTAKEAPSTQLWELTDQRDEIVYRLEEFRDVVKRLANDKPDANRL